MPVSARTGATRGSGCTVGAPTLGRRSEMTFRRDRDTSEAGGSVTMEFLQHLLCLSGVPVRWGSALK